MSMSNWSPTDIQAPLDQRAERIRSLVTTARTCIIEIGRELIAAKAEVPHGEWLPWLEREFGWHEMTAQRYMRVAEAFVESNTVLDLAGINLSATALYVLSEPTVLPEVRTEAVARAEAGEVITKKAAEEMVKKAEEKAKTKVAELIQKAIEEQAAKQATDAEAKIRESVEAAKQGEMFAQQKLLAEHQAAREKLETSLQEISGRVDELAEKKAAPLKDTIAAVEAQNRELEAAIKRIKSGAEKPDINAIANTVCLALGTKKLSEGQWRLLAQMTNQSIAVGGKRFEPISADELKHNEERLRIGAEVTEALQMIAGSPPPKAVLAVCYPVHRALIRERLPAFRQWISDCENALQQYPTEEF